MFKKVLSLLLCIVLCVSLLPLSAFAEEETGTDDALTALVEEPEPTPEVTPEPTEEPEPTQEPESTSEVTPEPTPEVTPEPTAAPEPTPVPTAAPEETPVAAVRVSFNCTPEETLVWVYEAEDEDTELEPEEDGSFLLTPGEYVYVAFCEGYTGLYEDFIVGDEESRVEIEVVLQEGDILEATPMSASASEITQQIKDTYQAALRNAGRTAFQGYCGAYVNWQLVILGINSSYVGADGNQEFDTYKNMSTSSGGYSITAYPASNYTLSSSLNAISANGTKDVYNILVGFETGSGSDGALYGHTCFIHAVIGGTVYFSESFYVPIGGGYSEGSPIACSISDFCNYYDSWTTLDGLIHFSSGEETTDYLSKCDYYPACLEVSPKNGLHEVWSLPCSDQTDPSSEVIYNTAAPLTVTALYKNSVTTSDHYWYKVSLGGITTSGGYKEGYVYAPYCQVTNYHESDIRNGITYSGKEIPTSRPVGKSYAVDWTISSNYADLSSISGYIGSYGDTISFGRTAQIRSKNLNGTDVDNGMRFDLITTPGTYNLSIKAKVVNYYCEDGSNNLKSKTYEKTVINSNVAFVEEGHTHSYSSTVVAPTCTEQGYTEYTCSCGASYRDNYTSTTKHNYVNAVCIYCGGPNPHACGNNLVWTLNDSGVLTITGDGEMWDYNASDHTSPWYDRKADIVSVCIKSGATSIGEYAFFECENLVDVTIPNGLVTINGASFFRCKSLTSINLPYGLTSIGGRAFAECGKLKNISIPDTVSSIGQESFDQSGIESIVLPNGITTIPFEAFARCASLTSVYLPGSVTIIDDSAFDGCERLTSINIPDKVTAIGMWAFRECNMASITLPRSVANISREAFAGCNNLAEIKFEHSYSDSLGFGFNVFGAGKDTKAAQTTVIVPDVNNINPSISGYDWADSNRTVTYKNETQATDIVASGSCGNDLTWTLDENGTLTISGTGEMAHYNSPNDSPWHGMTYSSIVIESGVESIGDNAFSYLTNCTMTISSGCSLDLYGTIYLSANSKIILEDGSALNLRALKTDESTDDSGITYIYGHFGKLTFRGGTVECRGSAVMTFEDFQRNRISYYPNLYSSLSNATNFEFPAEVMIIYCFDIMTAEELYAALETNYNYAEIALYASITVNRNITIPYNYNFLVGIGEGIILTVPAPYTITNNGFLQTVGDGKICIVNDIIVGETGVILPDTNIEYITGCQHTWDNGTVTTEPGCETKGVKTYSCTACGETRTEDVSATGHVVVTDPAVAATCTENGKSEGSHCSACGEVLVAQEVIPATGHSFGEWTETKAPSLTEDGEETRSCQNPGCDVSETRAVKAVIYTISYDANGGSGAPEAQQKLKGTALTLSSMEPTYSGFVFKGWALSETATTAAYAPGTSYTADESVTLYAVWEEEVIVDENAPAIVASSVKVRPGEEVDVTLSLKNNPGIIGMTLKFEYDTTAMTLISMTESGLEGVWQKNKGVTWASSTGDSSYNGVFLTLRFAVNADAAEGDYQIKVLFEEGDICNDAMEDVNFASVPGTITVRNRVIGDVNGDGKVNTKDFIALMKHLAGEEIYYVPGSLDINGDGKVNTKDFIALMKYLAGEDVEIH